MLKRLGHRLRTLFAGKRLTRAIERNEKAANALDELLRKVVKK